MNNPDEDLLTFGRPPLKHRAFHAVSVPLSLFSSLYPVLSRACLLEKLDPSQDSSLTPGNSSIPRHNFNYLSLSLICFAAYSQLYICLFLFIFWFCHHPLSSRPICSALNSQKEKCVVSLASTPFPLHHPITPAARVISLSSCRRCLIPLSSIFLRLCFASLSPADPSQWISEALLIAGTSLCVRQAKESHTKHAWLNIVHSFSLPSTVLHVCLKLNQPSSIWKHNPPYSISLPNASPQSLSPLSDAFSFSLLPAHTATREDN